MNAHDKNRLLGAAVLVTLAALAAAGCVPAWQYNADLAKAKKQAPAQPAAALQATAGVEQIRVSVDITKPPDASAATTGQAMAEVGQAGIMGLVAIFNNLSPIASVLGMGAMAGAGVANRAVGKPAAATTRITIEMPVTMGGTRAVIWENDRPNIYCEGDPDAKPAALGGAGDLGRLPSAILPASAAGEPPSITRADPPALLRSLLDDEAEFLPQPPGIRVQ